MSRHETETQSIRCKNTGRIITYTLVQVIWIHKMDIAKNSIHILTFKLCCNCSQHIIRRIKIIRIQYAHHISRGELYPLIHCIIKAIVRL